MGKITEQRLRELERSEAKLQALERGGIDNWEGYEESLKEFNKYEEIEKRIDDLLVEIQEHLLEGVYEPSERGAGFAVTEEACENTREIILKFVEDLKELNE